MYHRYKGPSRRAVQRIYRRSDSLDNSLTDLVFCSLMFSLWLHDFLTLSILRKEMDIVEKKGGLPAFDTDILNTFFFFFFLPTAENYYLAHKSNRGEFICHGRVNENTTHSDLVFS